MFLIVGLASIWLETIHLRAAVPIIWRISWCAVTYNINNIISQVNQSLPASHTPTHPSLPPSSLPSPSTSLPPRVILAMLKGPVRGVCYPCPPSEFWSLVCPYFTRFLCHCRNFDKTSIACRHFVALVLLFQGHVRIYSPAGPLLSWIGKPLWDKG